VVTPDGIVTAHLLTAGKRLVAAVSVIVAVAVPEFDADAVKVVESQPAVIGVARALYEKPGRTIAISSAVSRFTLALNVNESDVDANVCVTGRLNILTESAGALIPVDSSIEVVATSVEAATMTSIVRSTSFAACGEEPVVTPVAIAIVH